MVTCGLHRNGNLVLIVFFLVLTITFISAGLAFRIQYLVLLLISISLLSILGSRNFWESVQPLILIGDFPGAPENEFIGTNFWGVFATMFFLITYAAFLFFRDSGNESAIA